MILSLTLFSLGVLAIPTIYELWNEKKGEAMKSKKWSMFVRVVIAIGSVWVAAVFKNDTLWLDVLKSAALSFGIFFGWFDYLINLILGRKPWYSYLSKSPLDRLWNGWNWRLRMAIRVAVFAGALVWFSKIT